MVDKTKPAIALNGKTVSCPKCTAQQPAMRFPRNLREVFFGGWTCERCATEMDKFGRPIY